MQEPKEIDWCGQGHEAEAYCPTCEEYLGEDQDLALNPIEKCPRCGKNILEKTSKKGIKYYACEDYKDCKLMLWGIPTGETCPLCNNGYLYINKMRNSQNIRCSAEGCSFTKNIEKKEQVTHKYRGKK